MAKNWNTRRAIVNYAEKIEDASARLQHFATLNNYLDRNAVVALMNSLKDARTSDVDAAIARAQTFMKAMEALLDVLKNEKKLQDANKRLATQQESVVIKELQRDARLQALEDKSDPHPPQWALLNNDDDEMQQE